MVELAVVEEHVRVRVRCDGERALANAGADQRPGLALPMPKTDPPVPKVVWRPCRRARGSAGPRDCRPQPLLSQTRKHRPPGIAVLAAVAW